MPRAGSCTACSPEVIWIFVAMIKEHVMRKIILVVLSWLALSSCFLAHAEAGPVGIVVMHGKWDKPGGSIIDFSSAMVRVEAVGGDP